MEHNGSISISINNGVPPKGWFFRFSMGEMADYLISASQLTKATGDDFLKVLEAIDSKYEHDLLEQRLRQAYPEIPSD